MGAPVPSFMRALPWRILPCDNDIYQVLDDSPLGGTCWFICHSNREADVLYHVVEEINFKQGPQHGVS